MEVVHGDCLEIMKGYADKQFDLLLTDPPYGIDVAGKSTFGGRGLAKNTKHDVGDWDKQSPSQVYFDEMRRVSKVQVIWGGNYFTDKLPQSDKWLVWDKDTGNNKFSDAELAWTSEGGALRLKKYLWRGMLQGDMKHKEPRWHPTQKPVEVMKWVLSLFPNAVTILDPFCGAGSTLVACRQMGRYGVGIEISEKYCEIARARISQDVLF